MTEPAPAAPAPAGQAPGQGEQPPASGAAPAAPAAGEKPWYDGHITQAEDIGYLQNKAWKTPGEMLTAYKSLESFRGVPADQLLTLPKDMSDDKAMGEVYNRLGRPDNENGYDFKLPEAMKDVQLDEGRMKFANNLAYKMGLNKAQHNALVTATLEYEGGIISESQTQIDQIQTEQLQSLKKEWGAGFDERSELGRRAANMFLPGDKDQKAALLSSMEGALGTGAMLKLFANIGEKLGEDKIHSSNDGERKFGYTPEQAKADIQSLNNELRDPANKERLSSYNQGKGKDYENMQRLQRIANNLAA